MVEPNVRGSAAGVGSLTGTGGSCNSSAASGGRRSLKDSGPTARSGCTAKSGHHGISADAMPRTRAGTATPLRTSAAALRGARGKSDSVRRMWAKIQQGARRVALGGPSSSTPAVDRSSKPPEGGGGARATLRGPRPTLRAPSEPPRAPSRDPRAREGILGRLEVIFQGVALGLGGSAEDWRRARTDPRTTLVPLCVPPLNDASEALQSLLWGLRGSFKGGASARVVRGSVRALRPPTPPTL